MYEAGIVDDAEKAKDLWGMFDQNDWWRQSTKEGRLTRTHLDRFLNYWMIMQTRNEVTAHRVSSEFSSYLEATNFSIKKLAAEIKEAGRLYQDMEEAKHPGIETFSERMKIMGLGVVMPLLLCLYTRDFSKEKRIRSIRAVESYLVRRMLCGLSSAGLNKLFIELVRKLAEKEVDQVDRALISHLKGQTSDNRQWPKDNMLKGYLIKKPLLKANPARQKMVLHAIETHLGSDKVEKPEPGQSSNLTVEHIMPKSWKQNWPLPRNVRDEGAAREVRNQAVMEIGNLTLVTGTLNINLSNAPWRDKQKVLREQTMRLNWELLDGAPEVWNEAAIRERSKKLVGRIVEIWPYADKI